MAYQDYSNVLVHGDGRMPCDHMLIGEGPGWHEARKGVPFVGPTGTELDRLFESIGQDRVDWFFTNIYRMMPPGKKEPYTDEHYERSLPYLLAEIEAVNPKLIVTLGRPATRFFMGDVDMDEVWGLHLTPPPETFERLPMLRRDVTIAPQIHPAAGFHSPEQMCYVIEGFRELRGVLDGSTPARALYHDQVTNPIYLELETPEEFHDWWSDDPPADSIAIDTEGYAWSPWSVQLSTRAGEAVMLRGKEVVERFRQVLAFVSPTSTYWETEWQRRAAAKHTPRITLHNGLHDLIVLRSFGIDLIEMGYGYQLDDTMVQAYLLGVLPQGLKPLSTRLLGMRMQSYQEVLGKAQDRLTRTYLTWLWDALAMEQEEKEQANFIHLTTTPYADKKGKIKPGRKLKKVPKLPKVPLQKAVERVMGSKEPYRLWGDQVIDIHVAAHKRLGAMPEASLTHTDKKTALNYACRDADATNRVKTILQPKMRARQLQDVYALDMHTYPILDRMMRVGLKPDPVAFEKLAGQLDDRLELLKAWLATTTGKDEFNPNSGDQVADFLYDTLGLEPLGKLTESGRGSTNDKVLEALERAYPEHQAIADIRDYREYYKLRWTFVDRLPELMNRWPHNGRIHCQLKLTRTPSGRLAAAEPNLLALPKHGDFAKAFRRCFVADEGHIFLSSDLSQIELRVLAHLSQDPYMLAVYRGEVRNPDGSLIDLHAALAQKIFGVAPKDQDESKHRLPAKAVNFGIPMGMTCVGLCLELRKSGLDVDEDDAQRWIDEANKAYAGVPVYKQACIDEAYENGFVRCLSGRVRHIGGIRNKEERIRAEAERFAFSTKIQEGAQTVGKGMLRRAWDEVFVPLRKRGDWIEPLLWIHDDLLSEMAQSLQSEAVPAITQIMSTAPSWFTVPVKTDPKVGTNWCDLKKVA